MRKDFVKALSDVKASEAGVKAHRLSFLRKMGFRLPKTYVCTFRGYENCVAGNKSVIEEIRKELKEIIDEQKSYSVSLSANTEILTEFPSAGKLQWKTTVKGLEQIIEALVDIWELTEKCERAHATVHYDKNGRQNRELKIAIVIQEKTRVEYSGVVFTRNPTSGTDEVIVESVFGTPKDMSAQEQIGIQRWVYKWGTWRDKPKDDGRLFEIVKGVMTYARRIEKKYGGPVRLEWVYDGNSIYLMQFEAIPSFRGVNIYSNKMAKERMPGIVKPLVWDINVLLFNSSWKRILVELVGKYAQSIDFKNMSKPFYYRAYFNMGVFGDIFELVGMPRESMELVFRIETGAERLGIRRGIKIARALRFLPRMIIFTLDKFIFSRKLVEFLETQKDKLVSFKFREIEEFDERRTLEHIEELIKVNREASYFAIVTQMLTGFYNLALETYLKEIGVGIEKIDLEHKIERMQDIDPDHHLSFLHNEYEQLPEITKLKIREMSFSDMFDSLEGTVFKKLLADFLMRFGHVSDSNSDFSRTQLKETSSLVLKMIEDGKKKTEPSEGGKLRIDDRVRNPGKKALLRILRSYYTRYIEYSKRVSYIQSWGYALFRDYFLHLGRLFKKEGYLDDEQDIFYMTFDEIRVTCSSKKISREYRDNLERRKNEIKKYQDVILPEVIYGDIPPIPLTKRDALITLKGVAASKGYCEGRVKIVKGFQDFDKIQYGEVLVIPYSHASWTPLFAKAKALISESGGITSHCSILARERGMPAVVSVKGALELEDDTRVVVDGYKGEVLVVK
ncbi:MAG: PEP-utilizing enzyme [Candidatus Bathyarchaeia archaeon]